MRSFTQGFPERALVQQLISRGIHDQQLLSAFRHVDRRLFVPASVRKSAYRDVPLPIGLGQTISQPYIVALMTSLLEVHQGTRVLEIGTGSGYQTAILAWMGAEIWTVERLPELQDSARQALERHGLAENVHYALGDGYEGLTESAPFERIILTCAPEHLPEPLLAQLADPGRMVLPVGEPGMLQRLMLVMRTDGQTSTEDVAGVAFVPLVRKEKSERGQ